MSADTSPPPEDRPQSAEQRALTGGARRPASRRGRRGVGGRGVIALFARHRTAANLLMALMILGGLFGLTRLNTQFFPDFGIDVVTVSVVWPGASAEDVDADIVGAIEPEVRFLDDIRHVRSTAIEGMATVTVEFEPGSDMQKALSEVEAAVAQVTTLPEDSETPIVKRIVRYDTITRLLITGPYEEATLKELAKRIREELLDAGVDKIDISGARDEEIHVRVDPEALSRLDLTLSDVAGVIGSGVEDLPAGTAEAGAEDAQIRSLGAETDVDALRTLEVRAGTTGERVLLGDIAALADGFDSDDPRWLHSGRPALELHVQRALSADALEVAAIVDDYLAKLPESLPPGVEVQRFDVMSNLISDRINLLLKNGLSGLALVLVVLFVFLDTRAGIWVAVGIPVSLAGALFAMWLFGLSINMISLFAMILALGIIVDDAIVVGEHATVRRARGDSARRAVEAGAKRMVGPVVSASLTTVAAFLPLLVISDIIGQIIADIPKVVVAILIASLIECFLVLPGHLRHAFHAAGAHARPSRFRRAFDDGFDRLRAGVFTRIVEGAIRWRYLTLSAALAAFVLTIGLLAGGRVGFVFFPTPETDTIYANVTMTPGTPRARTEAMLAELERSLKTVENDLTDGAGGLVLASSSRIGASAGPAGTTVNGDHVAGMHVELIPGDRRAQRTPDVIAAWRQAVRPLAGVETLTIVPRRAGPPGRDLDIRLEGGDVATLKRAAESLSAVLARFDGVSDIADDLPRGKREWILEMTPRGRALGFSAESVARQVRNAVEGAIATRFTRGDEEVTILVAYPANRSARDLIDGMILRAPSGAEVDLADIVRVSERSGFARIKREDGARQVAVTAEIDSDRTSPDKVIEALEAGPLPQLARDHGIRYSFAGRAEEQARTFADMRIGAMVALAAIYIILAWVFANYARPLAVMAVIPFGLVGAVAGHLLLGYDLTVLSLIGLIGLSGILVNDSIILVSTIEEMRRAGTPLHEALVSGARERVRAVLLTSMTTIGGLAPLLFETSLQAQFLIPMAITIVFGLMLATLLVLVVVPSLIAVQGDVGMLRKRLSRASRRG